MANIKLLEGLTIAAETLGGEVVFFPLSGTELYGILVFVKFQKRIK